MKKSPKEKDQTTQQPVKNPALLLTMTALDTTWRMFVPVIGGVLAGVALDNSVGSSPIGTTIGLIAGSGIAVLLVKRQLMDVTKS